MADRITATRFVASAVIAVGGAMHNSRLVVGALLCALASDVLDGPVARALGHADQHGARLDSRADCAVLCVTPVSIHSAFRTSDDRLGVIVALVYVSYAIPILVGALKFHRLTSYHTWAARAAGVALAVGLAALLAWHAMWPLEIALAVFITSAIEEIGITLVIPTWRADVRSLGAAVRLVRPQRATTVRHSSP